VRLRAALAAPHRAADVHLDLSAAPPSPEMRAAMLGTLRQPGMGGHSMAAEPPKHDRAENKRSTLCPIRADRMQVHMHVCTMNGPFPEGYESPSHPTQLSACMPFT